ncbi:unnamed protein product [Rotaria sp. Silwood1]|nr:unnamed protein product [Rotaria sp. Silwood1]
MSRCSSRSTAGVNHRYSTKEYVLASFMKGKKHAVVPMTAININPINMGKGEIKICGDTQPLTIVSKGTKAQMHMDKTKFARQTGSEEIDLGNFFDSEDEKENEESDLDMPTSLVQTLSTSQGPAVLKENSTEKLSQSNPSSRPITIHTTNDKPLINFDTIFDSPLTSNKRTHDSSSLDTSEDDEDAFLQYRCPGIANINETWLEVTKSMASLANDIKKNMKTKLARQVANSSMSQQPLIGTIPSNDMLITPDAYFKQNLSF